MFQYFLQLKITFTFANNNLAQKTCATLEQKIEKQDVNKKWQGKWFGE